jgi:ferritin-like metal-binding protein YciE
MASEKKSSVSRKTGSRASTAGRTTGSSKKSRSKQRTADPRELLANELREIHSAESQLAQTITLVAKAVDSKTARSLVEDRLRRGERPMQDIEASLRTLDSGPGRKKNKVAGSLAAETGEHVRQLASGPGLDALLIGDLLKTEHYCMGAWEAAMAIAEGAGDTTVTNLMSRELQAGRRMDQELTQLASQEIRPSLRAMVGVA